MSVRFQFALHLILEFIAQEHLSDWNFLGFIRTANPTVVFRAPWRSFAEFNAQAVNLLLVVDTEDSFTNIPTNEFKEELDAFESAKAIAKNLYDYMSSFAQSTGKFANLGDVIVIPSDCMTKWLKRFEEKHRINPFFWMRRPKD